MKKNVIAMVCLMGVLVSGCSDSNVVATVNGKNISKEEFSAYLKFKRIPEQDKDRVARALDEYLERTALVAAIEKTDVLDEQQLKVESDEFHRQMVIGRYFEQKLKNVVDEAAVRNFYSANQAQYESQRVHAGHILFRISEAMGEPERQEKLSRAHEAYSRLQKGEDFATVAKSYSEDTVSAEKGGDLGWLQDGAVDAEFSKKLFALKPGEITEPILTPFGFHIVKMIEGPQSIKRPLEAVEGEIQYQLRNEAKTTEIDRLMKTINVKRQD